MVRRRLAARLLTWTSKEVLWRLMKVSVEGIEHLPQEGGVILAGNHVHPIEAPLIGGMLRRSDYFVVVSAHLARRGLVRRLINLFWNVIWIDRLKGREALLGRGAELLSQGAMIVIMPEGRYSPTGRLGRGEPGAAELALAAGVPVVPIGSSGLERALAEWKRFRRPEVSVRFGPPIALAGDSPTPHAAHERLMCAIAELLPPDKRGVWAAAPVDEAG